MRTLAALLLVFVSLTACGGGGGDDGSGPPDAPMLTGDRYAVTWGPITVQPQQEDTRCVTLRIGNTVPIKVHQIRNTLSTLSHHFIVYRDNAATQESTTPTPCQPFAGTLNPQAGSSPIIVTQMAEEIMTLPDRVGYSFKADQFVRLEMHFINAGDAPAEAQATAELYAVPDSDIDHEAEFLFIGSPDIDYSLAPGESATLEAYFAKPASLNGINYFAITGHTHQLGTDMDVSIAPSRTGERTEIYNPTPYSWDEPQVMRRDFTVPDGGGFDFHCTWTNNTGAARSIQFGESANDEMCFFWSYYYPSQGAKVCIHTEQFGSLDICCPDAGPQICDFLNN